MADQNLLYTKPISGTFNYQNQFSSILKSNFQSIFEKKEYYNRLEKARLDALQEEQKFYTFFGAIDWEDFKKKLNNFLNGAEYQDFLDDYKKLTNTGLQIHKKIYEYIAGRKSPNAFNDGLSEKDKEALKEAFIQSFLLDFSFSEDGSGERQEAIIDRILERANLKHQKRGRADQQEIYNQAIDKIKSQLGLNLKNGLGQYFDEVYLQKGKVSMSRDDFIGEKSISAIFAKSVNNAIQTILKESGKDELVINYLHGGPSKKVASLSMEEKGVTIDTFGETFIISINRALHSNLDKILPTVDSASTGKPVLSRKVSEMTPEWRDKNPIEIANMNTIIMESFKKIGFTDATIQVFMDEIKKDQMAFIRVIGNPSQLIGFLGELLGERLLGYFLGNPLRVKGIGGSGGTKKDTLIFEDWWRAGKQPPVDLLVSGAEDSWGIQSKHSFSFSAQQHHSVGFINEKSIKDVFYEDLAELGIERNISGVYGNTMVDELVRLLELYFGNSTIQALLKQKLGGEIDPQTGEPFEFANIIDASQIINKIFAYFIDLIMDLGKYETIIQDTERLKQRNMFLLYLNEYFIPASEIINWVMNFLESETKHINPVKINNASNSEEIWAELQATQYANIEFENLINISNEQIIFAKQKRKILKKQSDGSLKEEEVLKNRAIGFTGDEQTKQEKVNIINLLSLIKIQGQVTFTDTNLESFHFI